MQKHLKQVVAALAAVMASSAVLASELPWTPDNVASTKTRAEVQKELADFQKNPVQNGWRYVDGDAQWVFVGMADSGKTRADVLKELDVHQKDPAAQARYTSMYRGS